MKTQLAILLLFAAGSSMAQHSGEAETRGKSDHAGFVTRLDTDRDGTVSSAEFDGPTDHFTQFDKNSAGYIRLDEAPTDRPPRQQR